MSKQTVKSSHLGRDREVQEENRRNLGGQPAALPINAPGIEACLSEVLREAATAGEDLEDEVPVGDADLETVASKGPLRGIPCGWRCGRR